MGQVSGTLGRAHRIIVLEGGTVVEDQRLAVPSG